MTLGQDFFLNISEHQVHMGPLFLYVTAQHPLGFQTNAFTFVHSFWHICQVYLKGFPGLYTSRCSTTDIFQTNLCYSSV